MIIERTFTSEEGLAEFFNDPPVSACKDLILTLCFSIQNSELLNKLGDFRCEKLILTLFDSDTDEKKALGEGCDKAFAKLFSFHSSHYKTFTLSWKRDEFPIEIAKAIDQALSDKDVIQDVTLELLVSHITVLMNENLIKRYDLLDFKCHWLPTDSIEKDKVHVNDLVNVMIQVLKSGNYSEKFELSFENLNLTVEQGQALINSITKSNSQLCLNFSSNQIGNELLIALGKRLKELNGVPLLRINASDCEITNEGLIPFIEMLPENCSNLHLLLKNNAIGDEGFVSLFDRNKKLPKNFRLDLKNNQLSPRILKFLVNILNDTSLHFPGITLCIGSNEKMLLNYNSSEEMLRLVYNVILTSFEEVYEELKRRGIKIERGVALREKIDMAKFSGDSFVQAGIDRTGREFDFFNGGDSAAFNTNDIDENDTDESLPSTKHPRR